MQALGLAPDADEREVRRAYARRVKAIDPATDPGAFQALREHYEAALVWVRMRPPTHLAGIAANIEDPQAAASEIRAAIEPMPSARVVPDPEPEAVAPVSAPVHAAGPAPSAAPSAAAPEHDADEQVFARFSAMVAQEFRDVAEAGAALESALEDPRLLNLEARTCFEWRVAQLLAHGWQPGHQFLFNAACDAFNWERDRTRLPIFGPVGAMLDAAITESLVFFHQPEHQFVQQRNLVVRLRDDALPSNDVLARERERLQMLVQRFPHWLRIVASGANVARWQEALRMLPPPPPPMPVRQAAPQGMQAPGSQRRAGSTDWSGFLLLIGILVVLANLLGRAPGGTNNPRYPLPANVASDLEKLRRLSDPNTPVLPPSALDPPWPPRLSASAASAGHSAAPAARAPAARDLRRAGRGPVDAASQPGTPSQPTAAVGDVPGTLGLGAPEPLWIPAPPHGAVPNRLKPSLELPTLSETDPANAPWPNRISYELVPRTPRAPASASQRAP